MIEHNGIKLNDRLIPIVDSYMISLKEKWYNESQKQTSQSNFIKLADDWFKSSCFIDLLGWSNFPCIDVIMGCTHFIESFVLRHGWDGFQILPNEYGYYGMMGKYGKEPGNLQPNLPLLISLPNWKFADMYPGLDKILNECTTKNIDVHIDFAWLTVARDIAFDLNHPAIKSFAMSLSKYGMQWNRIGLRWSKQRTMDSITIFNHYYGDVNNGIISCGAYMMNNLDRDYIWKKYSIKYDKLCQDYSLIPTKLAHVAMIEGNNKPKGIAHLISQ